MTICVQPRRYDITGFQRCKLLLQLFSYGSAIRNATDHINRFVFQNSKRVPITTINSDNWVCDGEDIVLKQPS